MESNKVTWKIISSQRYDAYINESVFGHPFSSSRWANLILETFGGSCTHLIANYQNEELYLATCYSDLPWMEPGTFGLGSIGYGGPLPLRNGPEAGSLFGEPSHFMNLLATLERDLQLMLATVTTFPDKRWHNEFSGRTTTQIIRLPSTVREFVDCTLTGNVRTTIRKALRQNVRVQEVPEEDIDQVCTLLNSTQESVGATYKTPPAFIRNLHKAPDMAKILGGYVENTLISCSVFIFGQVSCFHMFNGWNREFQDVCANQLLLYTAIEDCIGRGLREFNMGESHYDSLFQAKRKWGSHPVPLLRFDPNLIGQNRNLTTA